MKKASIVLIVIGVIFFAAGVFAIYTGFASQNSEENSLVFEKTVQARITDMRTVKTGVGDFRTKGGRSYADKNVTYNYYVEFFVSDDGGYSMENVVSAMLYKEYEQLEKNKDMEFNLYRNGDGVAYLSMKDLEGATEDYQSMQVTKNIAVRMIAGLIAAAVGWVLLMNGTKMRKKAA
ncbi:MAG: hypothetical protein K2N60_12100 [Oscillospiraceae bacterium]|nr:hypothetical protein [Oscillospiraceae bacterium]